MITISTVKKLYVSVSDDFELTELGKSVGGEEKRADTVNFLFGTVRWRLTNRLLNSEYYKFFEVNIAPLVR